MAEPELPPSLPRDDAETVERWKRMSLRLLCFVRRFHEALSSLTYVLRSPLRQLLDFAVTQIGPQRLLLHKDFGEAGDTSSIAISLLVMIGAKKSISECHHYAASVRYSPPNIWYMDCPVCQGRWCRTRRSTRWRRMETPFPTPIWQGLSSRWEDAAPPPDWIEDPELMTSGKFRDEDKWMKSSPGLDIKLRHSAV